MISTLDFWISSSKSTNFYHIYIVFMFKNRCGISISHRFGLYLKNTFMNFKTMMTNNIILVFRLYFLIAS